mmetsp:Transcript_26293/g.55854  ORF Transcript_26293/g.55854 Transcript_26293/m.55854 type:complete len:646 (+) Transcript_26293:59-1996(+)
MSERTLVDGASSEGSDGEGRQQYANKCELMLSLVGYAVGLGNIWRFPYLTYTYGGGAFLVPYFLALLFLGIPLFILELGLGQIFRQGTLGVWVKMGKPRLKGVGIAATTCTFLVALYYNVILAWTIYYIGRTTIASYSGILPWSEHTAGFHCPETAIFPSIGIAYSPDLFDSTTGLFNPAYSKAAGDFWCPAAGTKIHVGSEHTGSFGETLLTAVPAGFVQKVLQPEACPARAAVQFWEKEVLQQSSGMDDLGGINFGLLIAYTVAWLLVYFIVFKGVASSGKVVYVTALLPYVALTAFFIRAITLENAFTGLKFFLIPDFSKIFRLDVWLRAVTQIFYSLGVGFGAIIAFASYGAKKDDFVGNATKVAVINCSTSIFAGFVVFPVLGFLANELSQVDPCISADDLSSLEAIGLTGTGLAFIAFPIAIARMPLPFVWSVLFFAMLLCLGIDSQFAMVESVMTVLHDSGIFGKISKPKLAAIVCGVSYLIGMIFVTRGGVYWFNLFDYYTCVVAMFFVTFMECMGLMWCDQTLFPRFKAQVKEWTGRTFGKLHIVFWKYTVPAIIAVLMGFAFKKFDIMDARDSVRYPEGLGYLPNWSIAIGWCLGLLPIVAFVISYFLSSDEATEDEGKADDDEETEDDEGDEDA